MRLQISQIAYPTAAPFAILAIHLQISDRSGCGFVREHLSQINGFPVDRTLEVHVRFFRVVSHLVETVGAKTMAARHYLYGLSQHELAYGAFQLISWLHYELDVIAAKTDSCCHL